MARLRLVRELLLEDLEQRPADPAALGVRGGTHHHYDRQSTVVHRDSPRKAERGDAEWRYGPPRTLTNVSKS